VVHLFRYEIPVAPWFLMLHADVQIASANSCCHSQPFTYDFHRADIHEMLSPDILLQLIKGVFEDHLVDRVEQYIIQKHGNAKAQEIMADIDRRIAVVPAFSGLRRFTEGRAFKQWTGDDSKALMKVYLPAIAGHVPRDMVLAICAFHEFCYIARRNVHTNR